LLLLPLPLLLLLLWPLQVYIVSDLLHPVEVQLTVRMLSLADTKESCSSSSSHTRALQQNIASKGPSSATTAAAAAAGAASPWAKHSEVALLTVPAASAVLAWSGTAQQLLAAAPGCSRASCYVHITLATAAQGRDEGDGDGASMQHLQEATVWLAPFAVMQLPAPNLQLSNFEFVPTRQPQSARQSRSSSAQVREMPGEVAFTVSSSRVASFAVWELTKQEWQQLLPGHFTQNAATVHPCEPRVVRFVPRLGASSWSSYVGRLEEWQQRRQQQPAGTVPSWRHQAGDAGDRSSSSSGEVQTARGGQLLASLLQQSIAASSLYDHQQFEPSPSSSEL
jgi:hypothetical protein